MDLKNFSIFTTTFQLSAVVIISIALVHSVLSADPLYEACAPRSCGKGPNISYPFWIPEEQESYCGLPNFGVSCYNEIPMLRISNDDYVIKDIFYTNYSVLLVNSAGLYDDTCLTPKHNFSLDGTPFHYNDQTVDFYLFYDCPSNPSAGYFTYTVSCASNSSYHSFGLFHAEAPQATGYSLHSCQTMVSTPVNVVANFSRLLNMSYSEILLSGFVLNWTSSYCGSLEISGGRCGLENNTFICFCSDRPRSKTCSTGSGLGVRNKILIAVGVALALGMVLFLAVFIYHKRKEKKYSNSSFVSRNISSDYPSSSFSDLERLGSQLGVHTFTYKQLEEATNNFSESKEIGDGGFGTVYHGILKDGRAVAVKRLYNNNYKRMEQFANEVGILTRLHHPNLVQLYGCTSRRSHDLLLVYEYINNGTVADHVHGNKTKPGSLPWHTRLKIAVETASALTFLHKSDVIHRDVKTNNILLDDSFTVKVADFGLSRLFPLDVSHVSTAPQGTPGYVDPEYHQCYQLTDKSDVFSFGVVLVELISSKPAVDITRHRHEINLSNLALNKIQSHALHELVDPFLEFNSDYEVQHMISSVAALAFRCLQHDKELRPYMEEVYETLKGIQSEEYGAEKADECDVRADDVVLLKSGQPPLSPDTVHAPWLSNATTPNTSGL